MTVDVENILLTDTRYEGARVVGASGRLRFKYGGGCAGRIVFLVPAKDVKDEHLLEAAAALIAEYNQRIKECPF